MAALRVKPNCCRRLDFGSAPLMHSSFDDKFDCFPEDLGDVLNAAERNQRMRACANAMFALPQHERDYDDLNDTERYWDTMLSHPDVEETLFNQIASHPDHQERCRASMLPGIVYFNEYHHDPWTMSLKFPEGSNTDEPAPKRPRIPGVPPCSCTGLPSGGCVATEDLVHSFFAQGQSPAYEQLIAMDLPARRIATDLMQEACMDVGITFIGLILEAAPSDVDDKLVELTYHMFNLDLHWTIFRDDLPYFPADFLVRRHGL